MAERKSGVLLHITSLPSTPGIGTLGKEAFRACDWIKKCGFSLWQVLPLGPTSYGDSPYQSFSTFAGNPLLIDLDNLVERGWVEKSMIVPPEYIKCDTDVDYGSVVWWKMPLLYKCAEYFLAGCDKESRVKYEAFKNDNSSWLNNFADFTSIKKFYDEEARKQGVSGVASMWNQFWPKDLASHDMTAVSKWDSEHVDDIEQIKAVQFFFWTQWSELKAYANKNGIKIVGDIPIFVSGDSADVWASRNLFQYDENTLQQTCCAGVPPDYFSATGQLWGNPLYDWDAMKKDNYSWWVKRIQNMLKLVDVVRIDHFRGFEAYWKIPAGAETAIGGEWIKGPGMDLFNEISRQLGKLPIIAEDLGLLTPEVEKLRDDTGFPGMKIIQFAFDSEKHEDEPSEWTNEYLPHTYKNTNCIVYTGTHDNDTTMGLIASSDAQYKINVAKYFGLEENSSDLQLCDAMIRGAFMSSADTCIIPMQDVYKLGGEARMNTPSTMGSNWSWRMKPSMFDDKVAEKMKDLVKESKRK